MVSWPLLQEVTQALGGDPKGRETALISLWY